jgi:hypothetical protein
VPKLCDPFPKYNAIAPLLKDRLDLANDKAKAKILGVTGYPQTSRQLLHFLEGSGKDLKVDVDVLLKDKGLAEVVKWSVLNAAKLELEKMKTEKRGQRGFRTPYTHEGFFMHPKKDFLMDYGKLWLSYSGLVTKTGKKSAKVDYIVYLHKHYRWHGGYAWAGEPAERKGKIGQVAIGLVRFDPFRLGDYHRKGLAKMYRIFGESKVLTIKGLHGIKIPEYWLDILPRKPTAVLSGPGYCYDW